MLKINRPPPTPILRGKIALLDICASTTALTQFSTYKSWFYSFAASGAVLLTSTLNKSLT